MRFIECGPEFPEAAMSSTVFFDGVCGLCNASVDFILRHDRRGVFRVSPLQGETARFTLPESLRERLDTLVLQNEDGMYVRSAAVVRILWGLSGLWPIAGWLLWLIPWPLRDWGYRIVSANRIRWFGAKETCRIPTPEERERFLP
jgi:predicted DCC family thiol-disulfide oxidoreductase YuxK